MIHQMKVSAEVFKKIMNKQKTIESRLYDEKRKQINVADMIEFSCNDDASRKILTRVRNIYRYKSFEKMFSSLPIRYFGSNSKDELLEEIQVFYPKEEQEEYGVIGIEIELVDDIITL